MFLYLYNVFAIYMWKSTQQLIFAMEKEGDTRKSTPLKRKLDCLEYVDSAPVDSAPVSSSQEILQAPCFREYQGDLLELRLNDTDFIVHQTNCRTVGARGLAKLIFQKYPHSNTYKSGVRRVPGTISVHHPIINLYGQDGPGKVGSHSIEGRRRLDWFQKCLEEIDILFQTVIAPAYSSGQTMCSRHLEDTDDEYNDACIGTKSSEEVKTSNCYCAQPMKSIGTLYFPYQIGCGLAGGNWATYRSVLKNWADGKPYSVHVLRIN